MLILRNPSQNIPKKSFFVGVFPVIIFFIITGENNIDAIANRNVAKSTGEIVSSTIEAAIKLKPHTVATNIAAKVPLLSKAMFNR